MSEEEHARLREMLGAHALGHLPAHEVVALEAHLEGCAACRAELSEIAPLAGMLSGLSAQAFESPPAPPPDLGERIRTEVAREQVLRERDELAARRDAARARGRRRVLVGVAAALVLAAGVGVGVAGGRASAPPAAAPVPLEAIALSGTGRAAGEDPVVDEAGLIPHTWGTELRMEATGFTEGAVYRAEVRDAAGRWRPAGRFLGTGAAPMTCNLQSAVLRDDVTAVVVRDPRGRAVLRSRL